MLPLLSLSIVENITCRRGGHITCCCCLPYFLAFGYVAVEVNLEEKMHTNLVVELVLSGHIFLGVFFRASKKVIFSQWSSLYFPKNMIPLIFMAIQNQYKFDRKREFCQILIGNQNPDPAEFFHKTLLLILNGNSEQFAHA